ncbi:MAG: cofactor-independent phosphoglycerate mutase [Lentisphaeria bacterium]|nr:cofactor-independent phosphoglycerate mutase [Lentisphaeria bacterium]MBO5766483.1 cofactor-independent phosphoglycerate mutase [Lentisphaeria bacterium]MBO5991281.1 cofactor-independent phosphoglycerate mutase [Lentisphaeria bacterium]
MKQKAIIFLADGMADDPLMELGGKTPLEYANTPAMDSIAKRGASGTFLTLPDGLPTSSDVANMSVLGFEPEYNYPGRGPIEAAAQGIELDEDDIAWRCNLVYVSDDGFLRDYSAGHISPEDAAVLMADLETAFGSDEVTFYSGVSYRNLLVLHGKRFSPLVDYFKPDSSQDILLSELRLSAQTPEAQETVDFLIDLEERAAKFLANHPINLKKKSPANRIWPWSPGRRPALPDFSQKYQQRTGAIISAVDVIRGLGMCSNMQVIEVPGATGFVDTNYDGKAQAAIKAIEEKDFVYLHLEAIDECSHLGDLKLKIQAIEEFDAKIVAPVLAALEGKGIRFAVLPDHPVPIKLRAHTTTPVPVAMMGPGIDVDGIESFSETLAPQGGLGYMSGDGLMKRLLGL